MGSSVYVLLLAGGSGTRLWPRSRRDLPKQFLRVHGEHTLLQETLLRLSRVAPPERIAVVVGEQWSSLVEHQAREIFAEGKVPLVKEPCSRNTAPAIALGMAALREAGASEEDLVFVCPSDHKIEDEAVFLQKVEHAVLAASTGTITVFGIVPDRPDTGFGYVQAGEQRSRENALWYDVEGFVEKPDRSTAEGYVKAGNYYWNGGMFLFRFCDMARELERHLPEVAAAYAQGMNHMERCFSSLPSISIDHGVMEKAAMCAVVPLHAGWSDVGSWDSVFDTGEKDDVGNVTQGDVLLQGSQNNLVFSEDRLVTGIDLEDLLVVDTSDALFLAPRGSSQKVRSLVASLKEQGRKEAVEPRGSVRPWGSYKVLFEGPRFKIKHILVEPGKRLSLQYHHHRTEHWVVVRGTALVTVDDAEKYLHEGTSIFIQKNSLHRLENPGKISLEIVEIQNGEYLGEDDIVRLQDDYARK